MDEQTRYCIDDIYQRLKLAWEDVTILKAKVAELEAKNAELEAKLKTAKSTGAKKPKEYERNSFNITPEFMLDVLSWAKQKGLFDDYVREYRRDKSRDFEKPWDTNQVDIERAYTFITDKLNGIPSEDKPDDTCLGQRWLDYWYPKYRTKQGYIVNAYGAIPWLCFEKWREEHHG